MAKVSLEQLYENRMGAQQKAADTQAAVDRIAAEQVAALKARDDAQSADVAAHTALVSGVQTLPTDTVAATKDGKLLLVISGQLHVLNPAGADTVTVDDGQPDVPADVNPPADTVVNDNPPAAVVDPTAAPDVPPLLPAGGQTDAPVNGVAQG